MKGRVRILILGGLCGALVGLIGAYLYLRNLRDDRGCDPTQPSLADLARLVLSIMRTLRQIAALGRGVKV